ncbi:hypothetical protein [Candidatus Similichlamydia epinepheli]|uniref:hypothetical protein n=1 Tax=Candidatus Similichlamydia epinepheli TaxID=1903953 RepID=UPI0013006B2D|nr:hypothetical protein [Candidatus Similichlamydia epinepheli]
MYEVSIFLLLAGSERLFSACYNLRLFSACYNLGLMHCSIWKSIPIFRSDDLYSTWKKLAYCSAFLVTLLTSMVAAVSFIFSSFGISFLSATFLLVWSFLHFFFYLDLDNLTPSRQLDIQIIIISLTFFLFFWFKGFTGISIIPLEKI